MCVSWNADTFPDDADGVFVGVRATRRARDHATTHARNLEDARELQRAHAYKTDRWWPLWEYVTAPDAPRWWDDPEPFTTLVVSVTERDLEHLGPIVDNVLRARGTQQ